MIEFRPVAAGGRCSLFKTCCFALAVLTAAPLAAEERRGLWRASVGVLLGAAIADAHSSFGRPERNPLLRSPDGRFHARGFAIKSGVTGGAVAIQWLLVRRHRRAEPAAAVANFTVGSILTGVAVRNHRLSR